MLRYRYLHKSIKEVTIIDKLLYQKSRYGPLRPKSENVSLFVTLKKGVARKLLILSSILDNGEFGWTVLKRMLHCWMEF